MPTPPGSNSGPFTASRNGDCGNRLAAGEILPPFCVSGAVSREFAAGAGNRGKASPDAEAGACRGGSGRQVRLPAPGRELPWSLGIRICILFERQSFEFWMI